MGAAACLQLEGRTGWRVTSTDPVQTAESKMLGRVTSLFAGRPCEAEGVKALRLVSRGRMKAISTSKGRAEGLYWHE